MDVLQSEQELGQEEQLCVFFGVVERDDGDSVPELESKGVGRVVDEDYVLQRAVYDPEVFDVDSLLGLEAVLSEESMGYVQVVRVQS